MKKLLLISLIFFISCGPQAYKKSLINLDSPILLQATRNYLPRDVETQPSYTIYEKSEWDCKYKNEEGDYVCCNKRSILDYLSRWKYCLLVDNDYKAFAFIEPGTGEHNLWSEGKQQLFQKVINK